jgi:hypothetical protein
MGESHRQGILILATAAGAPALGRMVVSKE